MSINLLSNEKFFFFVLNRRQDFFGWYNNRKKNRIAKLFLFVLFKNKYDTFTPRLIELCGILYKEFDHKYQKPIFDLVVDISKQHTNADNIVAFCNFLWMNQSVLCSKSIKIASSVVDDLLLISPEDLIDTLLYVKESYDNIGRDYIKHDGATICFVIPEFLSGLSFLQPPIGILGAMSFLRENGHISDIIDNRSKHFSIEQLVLKLEKYDVIIVNTTPIDQVQNYFVDYRYVVTIQTIKKIREIYEKKKIIVCGSHGSVRPDLIEKECRIDYIIRGEYDYAINDVVENIKGNLSIENLRNVVYYDGHNYREFHEDSLSHPELNDNIFPDYDAITLSDYYGNFHYRGINVKKRNWSIVQTSRGCPFRCSFCYNFFGNIIRRYSINHVIKELIDLKARGIKALFFIDQVFTINRSFVLELCREILRNNLAIEWSCQTRIDLLDDELLCAMSAAGCYAIWLGVESVDDNVLLINNKGITRKQIVEKIVLLRKYQIDFKMFFMIGMMGDTDKTIDEMIDFLINNKLPCTKSIMVCTPRYGTKMYEIACREYPYISDDFTMLNQVRGRVNNKIGQDKIDKSIARICDYLSNLVTG